MFHLFKRKDLKWQHSSGEGKYRSWAQSHGRKYDVEADQSTGHVELYVTRLHDGRCVQYPLNTDLVTTKMAILYMAFFMANQIHLHNMPIFFGEGAGEEWWR